MAVVSFTEENYNALIQAMAQGAKAVKYADKEVVYRTLKEMKELKAMMEAALGITTDNFGRNRRIGDYQSHK